MQFALKEISKNKGEERNSFLNTFCNRRTLTCRSLMHGGRRLERREMGNERREKGDGRQKMGDGEGDVIHKKKD